MVDISLIEKYFPNLNEAKKARFIKLQDFYKHWNTIVNLISRKDIDQLYLHHVLHSLSICRYIEFVPGSAILDLGTGGGFPGIPLAIMFPDVQFHLIDATRKKINVVSTLAQELSLHNVTCAHTRVEDMKGQYDFVVSRAVAKLEQLVRWSYPKIRNKHINALPNGLIALKGGNLKAEIRPVKRQHYVEANSIYRFFKEPYFKEKELIYVQK